MVHFCDHVCDCVIVCDICDAVRMCYKSHQKVTGGEWRKSVV